MDLIYNIFTYRHYGDGEAKTFDKYRNDELYYFTFVDDHRFCSGSKSCLGRQVQGQEVSKLIDISAYVSNFSNNDGIMECKNEGFDMKAVSAILRLRKKSDVERQEEETVLDVYKSALGMD